MIIDIHEQEISVWKKELVTKKLFEAIEVEICDLNQRLLSLYNLSNEELVKTYNACMAKKEAYEEILELSGRQTIEGEVENG